MHPVTTPRLTLRPLDLPAYEALLVSMDALGQHLNIHVPAELDPEFGMDPIRYVYDKVKNNPDESRWWTHLFIRSEDRTLVGDLLATPR